MYEGKVVGVAFTTTGGAAAQGPLTPRKAKIYIGLLCVVWPDVVLGIQTHTRIYTRPFQSIYIYIYIYEGLKSNGVLCLDLNFPSVSPWI
ncbi:hypothetical protein SAMD00023353_5500380 [Rosellinia necatrix]|uniref:Uncharacterized protein n=1 Tax=Rosellinia necatrix TaxID=77044 RepID=A0A1S8A9X2_ROSNE|nr:hypothetical protein SAMD00023353_5500380 [Rosellinia necatrix]